jgi:fusion and transport protein UGO1
MSTLYGPLQLFTAEFFTTALGMPFEVGKTLLQIEYRPRKRFAPVEEVVEKERDWGAEDDEVRLTARVAVVLILQLSNPEEADVYFTDRLAASTGAFVPPPEPVAPDASGYLPDRGSLCPASLTPAHPSYLLKDDPEISRGNGVWGMIRRVRATPSEGIPGLWKGQLVTTIHGMMSNLLQPHVHSALLLLSPGTPDVPLTALPHPAIPLGISVASHLLSHLILSPLEIIRTRLIAMPTSHPSTPSSVSLFRNVVDEEGGFWTTYFHPNLLIPSVLEHTLRPLLTLSIPLLLERKFGISPDISPISYSLCDLSLNLASLLVLLPIETVRRRLQLQSRAPGGGKRIKTVVKVRERDYVGVVEAMWRIVTEETGVRRKRVMTEKDEGGLYAGIRQLYRGVSKIACQMNPTDPAVWHGRDRARHSLWPRPGVCRFGWARFRRRLEGNLMYLTTSHAYLLLSYLFPSYFLPCATSLNLPSISGQTIARSSPRSLSSSSAPFAMNAEASPGSSGLTLDWRRTGGRLISTGIVSARRGLSLWSGLYPRISSPC